MSETDTLAACDERIAALKAEDCPCPCCTGGRQLAGDVAELRQMLAAAEGAVSDWYCKACDTVFPDWGDKMRCSCGKGERWPSSFNQRRAERDCESAIKNANECLIAVRDSYLSMNEAKADAGKLREENGRLRAALTESRKGIDWLAKEGCTIAEQAWSQSLLLRIDEALAAAPGPAATEVNNAK